MSRNLVVCSDGTGNTFAQQVSNVSLLVRSVELSDPGAQLVFYDQGIGTNPTLVENIKHFKHQAGAGREGLEILDPPKVSLGRPVATVLGLAAGYGLHANLLEMYQALARHYDPATDRIFLVGFSRGAFTVRAFAGLLYRCGLPARRFAEDETAFRYCFAQAYDAYRPHCPDPVKVDRFRKTYQARDVEVRFLGIWDTVKSYGGLLPRSLPHLRHNPIVRTVRHALALNERRSWFQPTSWGGIDGDAAHAASLPTDARYERQDIREVWFTGCHSDIGGGDDEVETARIAFRWMMGEATHAGLLLDPGCEAWIFEPDAPGVRPVVHESYNLGWWFSDRLPRWELDNSTRPPGYPFKWRGNGKRCAGHFQRAGNLHFHSSVGITAQPGIVVETSRPRLTRADVEAGRAEPD